MVFRSTKGKADFGEIWLDPPRIWTTEVTKRARRDDVVMSVRAPVGPVNLCPQEICIGRGLAAIRPSETLLRDYLFYFLRNNQDRVRGGDGAVFPSISREQIAELEIPLPTLEEQRRIVAEIEGYQKVLDGARQILAGYRPQLDFNSEWETVKLEEAAKSNAGDSRTAHAMRRSFTVESIHSSRPATWCEQTVEQRPTQTLNELGLKVSKLSSRPSCSLPSPQTLVTRLC